MTKFYMVYVEGKFAPVKVHEAYEDAKAEALRLALEESRSAYVLQAITGFVPRFKEVDLINASPDGETP